MSRLIGENMSRTLGQTVLVENVVGAGGTLANDRVARSAPDGSTMLINHVALLAAPSLFNNLRYDTKTAFEPVGLVNNAPMALIGRKSIPGSGPKDYVSWIKEQGAKANFAHGGTGTNSHLCGVMMGNVLGFKASFVPYRGSAPAINDLLGRTSRSSVGPVDERAVADSGRNAARHRHHIARAAGTGEGRADDRRTRHARAQLHHVARALRGEGHAEAGNRRTQRSVAQGGRGSRRGGEAEAARKPAFPDKEMTPDAHARLFAADLPRVAKLVESAGIAVSEAK